MAILVVYSNNPVVRDEVRLCLGRSPEPGLELDYLMVSTAEEVNRVVEDERADLLVLDGEAWPTGGMGLCRELKNGAAPCPPVIVLIARRDDEWLAKWSQADGVVRYPLDAVALAETVVSLCRTAAVGAPAVGASAVGGQ